MRVALFVNRIESEHPAYTTTRLALAARLRGHEVWYAGAEDIGMLPDSSVVARAAPAPEVSRKTTAEAFLADVREAERETLRLAEVDVLWLRNDPAEDVGRPWAQRIGIDVGHVLVDRGVTVLNDPDGLERAASKMYVQLLPESVRPRTLVTRKADAVRRFLEEEGDVVLKPLYGSKGDKVFLIRSGESPNVNQIFETVASTGYVVAQQYLAEAARGDARVFLMNGRPLEVDGRHACFRRVNRTGDVRNNMSAGGTAEEMRMTETMLAAAEAVRPKLIEDGMFLVGMDMAGDRVLEVNVFSPGGIGSCEQFTQVDFCGAIVEALETKARLARSYAGTLSNAQIAVL